MPTKPIFRKTYSPEDFSVGKRVRIYLDSRKQGESRVREGIILANGLEQSTRIVKKQPLLKLLVEKSRLIRGVSELQLENNRGARFYMYNKIKLVDFLDRENH